MAGSPIIPTSPFFNISFPQICTAFTIIMASPEALLQLSKGCTAAGRITRKQHHNRDVNTRRVNRKNRADTSAWSVTPIINCQLCQCSAAFHMKVSARLTGWSRPLHAANKTSTVQQRGNGSQHEGEDAPRQESVRRRTLISSYHRGDGTYSNSVKSSTVWKWLRLSVLV